MRSRAALGRGRSIPYRRHVRRTPDHPGEYGGAMMIGGNQFSSVTGRRGRGSSPPGDHLITGYRTDGIFARKGGAFRVADVYDPAVGRARSAVEIHPADHGVTAGCFGIPSAQWPQAKQAIQDVMSANGGRAVLRVDGNGNAAIVAPGTLPGEIRVAGGATPAAQPGGSTTQPGASDTDKAIAAAEKRLRDMDNAEQHPSLGQRIGGALQDFAKRVRRVFAWTLRRDQGNKAVASWCRNVWIQVLSFLSFRGRMAERFKAAVLKTAVDASPPWVRIPLLPPFAFTII
jgi:hypothetical protein